MDDPKEHHVTDVPIVTNGPTEPIVPTDPVGSTELVTSTIYLLPMDQKRYLLAKKKIEVKTQKSLKGKLLD